MLIVRPVVIKGMLYLEGDKKQTEGYLGNDASWCECIEYDAVVPLNICKLQISSKEVRSIDIFWIQQKISVDKMSSFPKYYLPMHFLLWGLTLKMFICRMEESGEKRKTRR